MKRRFIFALFSTVFIFTACNKSTSNKEAKIERIVCLSPSGAEIIYALGEGDKVVARTDFCDYPAQIMQVESVGGFDGSTVSLEKIISKKADFVYGSKGMHDNLAPQLKQAGINFYLSSADSINSVYEEITEIGKILNCSEKAISLIQDLKSGFEKIKNQVGEKSVSVYWEVWNSPLMTAGSSSFINDMISAAGGKNIFEDVEQAYPVVSDEAVIVRNPEVIIVSDSFAGAVENVKNRNGWENVKAVKSGRIYALNADLISRPGPRMVEGTNEIFKVIR